MKVGKIICAFFVAGGLSICVQSVGEASLCHAYKEIITWDIFSDLNKPPEFSAFIRSNYVEINDGLVSGQAGKNLIGDARGYVRKYSPILHNSFSDFSVVDAWNPFP